MLEVIYNISIILLIGFALAMLGGMIIQIYELVTGNLSEPKTRNKKHRKWLKKRKIFIRKR